MNENKNNNKENSSPDSCQDSVASKSQRRIDGKGNFRLLTPQDQSTFAWLHMLVEFFYIFFQGELEQSFEQILIHTPRTMRSIVTQVILLLE